MGWESCTAEIANSALVAGGLNSHACVQSGAGPRDAGDSDPLPRARGTDTGIGERLAYGSALREPDRAPQRASPPSLATAAAPQALASAAAEALALRHPARWVRSSVPRPWM